MKKKAIFAVGFCGVFLSAFLLFTTAILAQNHPSVIVLLVPQLTREDIHMIYKSTAVPLLKQASIGELNIRTAISLKDIHNITTISAGARAAGNEWSRYAYRSGEKRAELVPLYYLHTGEVLHSLRNGTILLPYIPVLMESNERRNTGAIPGLLGETLEQHGVGRAIIGNSDTGSKPSRLGGLLTMNRKGITPQGWIGEETLIHTSLFPGGRKTDYSFLTYHIQNWKAEGNGLIVAELGDLERLARHKNSLGTKRYMELRKQVVKEIVTFAGELALKRENNQRILLLSASLPDSDIADKKRMAPVMLWENGENGGVLTSGTTRQPGLAANIDIAPSILAWLKVPLPSAMKGQPLTVDHTFSHEWFWETAGAIDYIYATRPAVLYPYVGVTIAVIVLSVLILFFGERNEQIRRMLSYILLFVLLIPFFLLLLPLLPGSPSPVIIALLLSTIGMGISLMLYRLPFAVCFLGIGLVSWLPPLLDGFIGGELIRRSYLGYDPVIGARYYGIGNEYMGVLLGGSMLSVAMSGELCKKNAARYVPLLLIGICLVIVLYMAWPRGGSKAGGILVFLAVLLYGIPVFSGSVWRKRYIVALLVTLVAVAGLFFVVNYQMAGEQQSHIGRAFIEVMTGNWPEIGRIMERKLTMNWRLILASIWSKLFIVSLLVCLLFIYYKNEQVRNVTRQYPYFTAGIKTISFGALIALLLNDSGIIAASLAMLYALIPLLYRMMGTKK